jgi:transcription antitermination factor NusA-like protein
MEKDWIKIFTSANYYRSEMVKQALAGREIDSVILSKQDSSYHNFGEIEVYVHQKDFSDALEVIILNQANL